MYSLLLVCPRRDKDILIADLGEYGTAGIQEADAPGDLIELRAFFEDEVDAAPLLDRFAPYAPELQPEEETDWQKEVEEGWPILEVGRTFFIVPAWNSQLAPEGRHRLVVHPGMACGTGIHETTQLSLEAMEAYLHPGERVLDVGCGSGILCEAAHLLGAGAVAGCDIDPDAVAAAHATLRDRAMLFVGSARAIRAESFDFTVANINAETVARLAADIRRSLGEAGHAALTGFPHRDLPRVRDAIALHGLVEVALLNKGDWACVVVRRR